MGDSKKIIEWFKKKMSKGPDFSPVQTPGPSTTPTTGPTTVPTTSTTPVPTTSTTPTPVPTTFTTPTTYIPTTAPAVRTPSVPQNAAWSGKIIPGEYPRHIVLPDGSSEIVYGKLAILSNGNVVPLRGYSAAQIDKILSEEDVQYLSENMTVPGPVPTGDEVIHANAVVRLSQVPSVAWDTWDEKGNRTGGIEYKEDYVVVRSGKQTVATGEKDTPTLGPTPVPTTSTTPTPVPTTSTTPVPTTSTIPTTYIPTTTTGPMVAWDKWDEKGNRTGGMAPITTPTPVPTTSTTPTTGPTTAPPSGYGDGMGGKK